MSDKRKRDWGKIWIHFICGFVLGAGLGFNYSYGWIGIFTIAISVAILAAIFLDRFWDGLTSGWW
jgi:hypothetical protein